MKTILMIGPDIMVMGGISTVVKGLLASELSRNNKIILVSSHVDGSKLHKLFIAIVGLIKTFLYFCFKKIDIVHIHGSDITSSTRKYFYFRLAKIFNRKVIYHFHGASFVEQYRSASAGWQRRIKDFFTGVDLVICLSESWRKAIMEIAPDSKVQVIHNSVSVPSLAEPRLNKGDQTINITFLGLIGERKGVFDLLHVMERLIQEGLDVCLNIGGNGDVDRLMNDLDQKKLKERVLYLGWINGDDKDALLRKTDIFVLPSYGEGMPMAILEAMSYGVPVVSTFVGGIPEVVKDGETGLLFQPGDINTLYDKLKFLITNQVERNSLGLAGRSLIESRFDLTRNVQVIENIYQSL